MQNYNFKVTYVDLFEGLYGEEIYDIMLGALRAAQELEFLEDFLVSLEKVKDESVFAVVINQPFELV